MSGWYGVRQLKSGRFQGRALIDGKRVSVGTFVDGWDAHSAVLRAKEPNYRGSAFTAQEISNIANAALDYYLAAR